MGMSVTQRSVVRHRERIRAPVGTKISPRAESDPPGAWIKEQALNEFHPNLPEPQDKGNGSFEIGSFDFHGQRVIILSNADGNWAVLGQLSRNLTLDPEAQRQALLRKSWSQGRTFITQVRLPEDDRPRQHFLIHERIIPMWLANITSSRISDPEVRENIELAQVEFADALHEYVSTRSVIRREPTKLEVARDLVAALEAKAVLETTNRILAPKASKWDRFMNSDGLIGMTAIADMLNLPVKEFTNWLVDLGVFRKQVSRFGANQNMPRRMYQKSSLFRVVVEDNGKVAFEVAYATAEGADFIIDEWDKRQAA